MKKLLCLLVCLLLTLPVSTLAESSDEKLAAIMDEVIALTSEERADLAAAIIVYMGFAGEGDLLQPAIDKIVPASTDAPEESGKDAIILETSRRNPAHVGQCVETELNYFDQYTAVMRITLNDFYRGERFESENDRGYMPEIKFENGEYVAVKATVEFVELKEIDVQKAGTDDPEIMVDAVTNFDICDSSGAKYDNINYNFGNKKELKSLREGGKTEGYFMFEVYGDDASPYLIYKPSLFADNEVWFVLE